MYDVDLDTLAHALDVPGSKLAVKGIASVRSRVANLKDFLPQFSCLDALQAALQEILAAGDVQLPFEDFRREAVQRIADTKFSTWDWLYGQSREADLVRSGALACGTVDARLCLDRGILTGVEFGGDFLGALPASGLASRLTGVRFDRTALLAALDPASSASASPSSHSVTFSHSGPSSHSRLAPESPSVSDYFDGVSPDALVDLLLGA
jgi:lipoate-protein ligase A